MSNNLVSVCIPTYNGATYLNETLSSINVQTYKFIEIIFSDDNSDDGTLEIIQDFIENSPFKSQLLHHQPNGIGANWNNCLNHANGEYIKFLFQDDVLEPVCIAEMVEVLEGDKTIALVACKRHFIIESDINEMYLKKWLKVYGDLQKHLKLKYAPDAIMDKSIFKSKMFYKAPVNIVGEPSAVLFRKDIIKKVGFFSVNLKQYLDCEYWFRILKVSKISILNKKLVKFRIHPNQATQKNRTETTKDYPILTRMLYDDYFWYLNLHRQKVLFLRFNFFGKLLNRIL